MADQPSNKSTGRTPESVTEAMLPLLRELARGEGATASPSPPQAAPKQPDPATPRAKPPASPSQMVVPPLKTMTVAARPVPTRPPEPTAVQSRSAERVALGAVPPPIEPPLPPVSPGATPLSDSMRGSAIAGWSIIILFFGVLGAWAMTAPLHGAVVANGVVKVEGNRRTVQHLDGGIVKELRIKEGAKVAAGDVLVVLDETQAQTEYEVLSRQAHILRATEVRLTAELLNGSLPTMPEVFKAASKDPQIAEIWNAQVRQFESRRAALDGQRSVINERIAQLDHQIVGAQAQVKSYQAQRASVVAEMESLEPLVKQGLIARPRYLQLERSAIAFDGQIADAIASIARSRQAIAEQRQQMAQLDNDRMTEVTRDLRDTQAKLLEVVPRMTNAQVVLSRMEIRAPHSGRVVGLTVFTVGAVIGKGEKIMEVVPDQDSLIVEAQIAVENISDVRPSARADVHLIAYQQRIVPVVPGEVLQISADRLTDNRTGQAYYVALVRIDEKELAALPNVQLYPGMPATVMIPTVERTALDFLLGPLLMSFNHAFRQR